MSTRVLFAESDASVREASRDYLVGQGFQVATAATGSECMDVIRQWRPDVMVLNPDISGGHGEQIARSLDEDPGLSCAIVLTTDRRDRKSISILVQEYLFKPFSMEQLAETVRLAMKAEFYGLSIRACRRAGYDPSIGTAEQDL